MARNGSDDVVRRIIEEVPQSFHSHGSLHQDVLWNIVEEHHRVHACVSIETGCGLSTLVLSQLSDRHTTFTSAPGDSLHNTQNSPYLRSSATKFVIGPSQLTVPKYRFLDPLDFVLLDGPHAYPFPDLEYYYVYPHIRQEGVLVVDDIHIPTIRRMYEFLRDDEMWEHRGDVRDTAFFQRTDKPVFDPLEGNWPRQRFNRRRFASPEALDSLFGPGWYQSEFVASGLTVAGAAPDEKDLKIAELEAHIKALKGSRSWRAGAPIRNAVDWLRRKILPVNSGR